MKKWQEYLDEAGYTAFCNNNECPLPVYKWWAYKNGESVQFGTRAEAEAFSKNVEKVEVNKEERKLWVDKQNKLRQNAQDAYEADFSAMFSHLPNSEKVERKVSYFLYEYTSDSFDGRVSAANSLIEIFDTLLENKGE